MCSCAARGTGWTLSANTRLERSLVAAGAIDTGWIEQQLGLTTGSLDPRSAVRRYLVEGVRRQLSPLPLFEPLWFDASWSGRGLDPLLRYLDGAGGSSSHGAHPLIEASADRIGPKAALTLAGRGRDGLVTPSSPQVPPVAVPDLRARIEDVTNLMLQETALRAGRVSHVWDDAADRRVVAYYGGLPAPGGAEVLVSVVMPVRNRPERVRSAIASVQSQTFTRWELLVVDDGSTDHTPQVVSEIAATDPRVRLLRHEHGGVSRARNHGIEAAAGRYTAFLDSDNTWRPHFLATTVAAMTESDLSAAYAVTREAGAGVTRYRVGRGGPEAFAVGNFVDLNVFVVRTELLKQIGGFDPRLRRMVDYDLAWRVSRRCPLALLPFVGVDYDASPEADRISVAESFGWDDVVRTRNTVDLAADPGLRPAGPGSVSVVIPARSFEAAWESVRGLCPPVPPGPSAPSLQVVVVDSGSAPSTARLLHGALPAWPGVEVVRVPGDLHRAGSFDVGLGQATGEVAVFVDAGVRITSADLAVLGAPLGDGTASWTRAAAPELRDRVVAARATAWRRIDGLDPVFVLEREVDDAVRRLTASVGSGVEVELAQAEAVLPPREASHRAHQDNEREFSRRYAEQIEVSPV